MAIAIGRDDVGRTRGEGTDVAPMTRVLAQSLACVRGLRSGGYVWPLVATTLLVAGMFALQGLPVAPLVWPVVALDAVAMASTIAVAALAAPRGWLVRDRFQMRLATTFAVLTVNGIFVILTFPGLRDGNALGGESLLASDPVTGAYLALLDLWILPVGVALATHRVSTRATDWSVTRHVLAVVAMLGIGAAIVALGNAGRLPDTLPEVLPGPLRWALDHATHAVAAFALWRLWPLADGRTGSTLDVSRRWLARALIWCLALRLASMIGAEMEVVRFNAGWYLYRVASAGAFASVVVALVRDAVRLFEIERERIRCWREVSRGLSGLGMSTSVASMRDEATIWLEHVFGANVVEMAPAGIATARGFAHLELHALRGSGTGTSLALERSRAFSAAEREAIEAFVSGASLSIQRARDAERAAAVKDEFLTMISHELRTPLTSVVGYATLLPELLDDDAGASADARSIARRLQFHADDLSRLIQALLVTSHDLAGVTLPTMEAVDLLASARSVADAHQAEAVRRDLRVVVVGPGEPLVAWCSTGLLERVLTILVDNALRYTPAGGTVTLRFDHASPVVPTDVIVAGSTRGHLPMVACTVADTGPGLPQSASGQLFEPFYRPVGADARAERGTGLGLFQARRLIELMHGRIEARGHDGGGSTFTVVLPTA